MKRSKRLCTAAALLAGLFGTITAAQAQIVSFDVGVVASGCETNASFVAPNVAAQTLCRGPGVTAGTVTNGFTGTNWNETSEANAIAVGDYFAATVTIAGGFNANVTSVVAVVRRSGTGPLNVSIRGSADSFATTLASSAVAANTVDQTITFDVPDLIGATGAIEYRIYAWGASAAGGTFRLTDTTSGTPSLTINGTVQGGGGGDPTGACCFANGDCFIRTAALCGTQGGTYTFDNQTCAAANCPQPTGACCVVGTCQGVFTESDCLAFNGTWGGAGTDCGSFSCPQPTGSCCVGTVCSVITQADCTTAGGNWTLAGSCTPNPCTGACCVGSTCSITTESLCTQAGGIYRGPSTTCRVDTCPSTGACCVGTNCTVSTYADCATAQGTWLGRNIACQANTCVRPALPPTVIAKDDFDLQRDSAPLVVRRVSDLATLPAPIAGQYFNVAQRFRAAPENLPFGLMDDSVSILPGDSLGIVSENKVDSWFGAVNMYSEMVGDANPDNDPTQIGEDEVEVLWAFNVTGRTNLTVSIDMAAMGDFEAITCSGAPACLVDRYTFAVSIDGGPFTDIFTVRADEAVDAMYTLAGGGTFTVVDPLKVDGMTTLTNAFASFTKPVSGTGTTLTLRLRAQSDGNTEAFAFDNIMIMGSSVEVTGGCCTAGNCSVATQSLCELGGGTYLGNGVACNAGNCSSAPTPCELADFNDVDGVTADDIFAFLDAWFAQNGVCMSPTVCSADINGVDDVTADDIFAFLDLWFTFNGQTCP